MAWGNEDRARTNGASARRALPVASLIVVGAAVAAAGLAMYVRSQANADDAWDRRDDTLRASRTIAFETDEGTAINVDVSPDGREIVFDLLGDIYTLPIDGGRADRLVGSQSWDVAPRYSPDGSRIAFVSDRADSGQAIWTVDRRGGDPRMLAGGGALNLHAPIWSHDGTEIAVGWGGFESRPAIVNVADGTLVALSTEGSDPPSPPGSNFRMAYSLALSVDRRYAYLSEAFVDFDSSPLLRIDRVSRERTVIGDAAKGTFEYKPLVSRTGRWLAYVRSTTHDGRTSLRIRDLGNPGEPADGEDRELLELADADDAFRWADDEDVRPNYAFTPDDSAIVLSMNGKLWRIALSGGPPVPIPFRASVSKRVVPTIRPRPYAFDAPDVPIKAIRAPVISPDGRTLVFTALAKLWVQDLETGAIRRLTGETAAEYSPALSPDGRWVAYLSYADSEQANEGRPAARARVMVTPLDARTATRGPRAVLAEPADYGPPVWFPDGRRILFSRPDTRAAGTASGGARAYAWVDVDTGAVERGGPEPPGLPLITVNDRRLPRVGPDDRIYFAEAAAREWNGYLGTSVRKMHIVSTRLDGSDRHTHVTVTSELAAVAIAPGARHALVVPAMPGGGYLLPIPPVADATRTVALTDPEVRRLTSSPLTSADWQSDSAAILALGPRLLRMEGLHAPAREFHDVEFSLPRHRFPGTFAVTGARVLTMAGARGAERVIDNGTIVVSDGRIAAVGDAARVRIPDGVMTVDAAGMTIVPGFVDVHEHGMRGSTPEPLTSANDLGALAYGITSKYDPSNPSAEAEREHFEMIETGARFGPRWFYSGPVLSPTSLDIRSLDDARTVVQLYDALGVVQLKEYLQPTRIQRRWLARAASEHGISITAHVGGLQKTMTRVADGFTAWDHSPFITPLYADVTTFVARSGTNFTATAAVNNGSSWPGEQGWAFYYREMLRDSPEHRTKLERFGMGGLMRSVGDPATPSPLPFEKLRFGRSAQAAAAVINAGGLVSIGAHNLPGLLTHWEMWAIQRGGASAMDVLRAGTINGARKIGIDHAVGSLEAGKLADFLILSANPLDDIRNTAAIRHVVANGAVYDADTMTRLWPDHRPPPRMAWQPEDGFGAPRQAEPLR